MQLFIDKCLCFWEELLEGKLTQRCILLAFTFIGTRVKLRSYEDYYIPITLNKRYNKLVKKFMFELGLITAKRKVSISKLKNLESK